MFNLNHRINAVAKWLFSFSGEELITGKYRWHSFVKHFEFLENGLNEDKNPDSRLLFIKTTVSEEDHHDVVLTFHLHGSLSGIIMDDPKDPTYIKDADLNKYIDAMFRSGYFVDRSVFDEAVTVQERSSIPPGSNPYNYDDIRMGCDIGHNWQAMFHSPVRTEEDPKPSLTELVLINTKTGRRFHLDLTRANELPLVEKKKNET